MRVIPSHILQSIFFPITESPIIWNAAMSFWMPTLFLKLGESRVVFALISVML